MTINTGMATSFQKVKIPEPMEGISLRFYNMKRMEIFFLLLFLIAGCSWTTTIRKTGLTEGEINFPFVEPWLTKRYFSIDDKNINFWVDFKSIGNPDALEIVWFNPKNVIFFKEKVITIDKNNNKNYVISTLSLEDNIKSIIPGQWKVKLYLGKQIIAQEDFIIKDDIRIAHNETKLIDDTNSIINKINLGSNFNGDDFKKVFATLEKKVPTKGEFETTASYNEKINSISENNIYIFKTTSVAKQYNADLNLMTIKVRASSYASHYISLDVKDIYQKPFYYMGSNAFGAVKEVSYNSSTHYEILFEDVRNNFVYEKSGMTFNYNTFKIDITYSPLEAKSLKDNLEVFLICKPKLINSLKSFGYRNFSREVKTEPFFVFTDFSHSEPTFNAPSEHHFNNFYINTELLELCVVNTKTGDVLKKYKL